MIADVVFYLAFAGLITHELDAIHKHEWRILFVLRTMPDDRARASFVLLHVPLLAVLMIITAYPAPNMQLWARAALSLFMVIHAGLHTRLAKTPKYEFHTPLSRGLIYGTAAAALVYLILLLMR
ncbi:MAG: DUF6713 family protein [Deinococcota bacterium]